MGIDHIGPRILKSCAVSLSGPLSLLFQRCIDLACIPDEWKIHVITPLLKKGDSADVSNYRPISLLCSVSKVLERLIFNHVSDHIYPYLSTYQFGFILDRSCLQQLLSTFSIILQNYSSHKQTDIVYLDFCKAFPTQNFSTKSTNLVSPVTFWNGFNPICHAEDNLFSLMVFTRPCYPSHLECPRAASSALFCLSSL